MIFLILVPFWLGETGQIWVFRAFCGKPIEETAWNFACWCILTTFRTDKNIVTVCWCFYFWCYFDLVKQVKFGVSRHFGCALWIFLIMVTLWLKLVIFGVFFWRTCGTKCWGGEGASGIFPTLCVEFCLVVLMILAVIAVSIYIYICITSLVFQFVSTSQNSS